MRTHSIAGYMAVTVVAVMIAAGVTQLVKAQSDRPEPNGGIRGEITGVHGERAVAGATVVIEGPGGRAEATTDAEGAFAFGDLVPGTYAMDVLAGGYQPRTGIIAIVVPNATSPFSVRMRVVGDDVDLYRVAPIPTSEVSPRSIEELLNDASREGWELVTGLSPPATDSSPPGQYLLILRKRD